MINTHNRIFKNEELIKHIRELFEKLEVKSYVLGVNENDWIVAEIVIDKDTEIWEPYDEFNVIIWNVCPLPNNLCRITIAFNDIKAFEQSNPTNEEYYVRAFSEN